MIARTGKASQSVVSSRNGSTRFKVKLCESFAPRRAIPTEPSPNPTDQRERSRKRLSLLATARKRQPRHRRSVYASSSASELRRSGTERALCSAHDKARTKPGAIFGSFANCAARLKDRNSRSRRSLSVRSDRGHSAGRLRGNRWTRRIRLRIDATALAHHGDDSAAQRNAPSRAVATVSGHGQRNFKHSRELERGWRRWRKCSPWNDLQRRPLPCAGGPSGKSDDKHFSRQRSRVNGHLIRNGDLARRHRRPRFARIGERPRGKRAGFYGVRHGLGQSGAGRDMERHRRCR
jgi:hypothetical protein